MVNLRECIRRRTCYKHPFGGDLLGRAETAVWRYVQSSWFAEEARILSGGKQLGRRDPLSKLCPFIDSDGLIRVGGRLSYCHDSYEAKHPIILPGQEGVVLLYVRFLHRGAGHFGCAYLISSIQEKYHVIGVRSLVKKIINKCVLCRKLNGRPVCPKMAVLPESRVTPVQKPFWNVGIDFFGPFLVKIGRGKTRTKNYGVVFTCMASRAIHLEVAESLDTSSFLQAFSRFVSRRGGVKKVYCDNGTNLVG